MTPVLAPQLIWLFVLAMPIASIAWVVTHEEVFREPREWFLRKSKSSRHVFVRKLCYMLTCEFCFSHYVTAFFLWMTHYTLMFDDWRGYVIAGFSLVWIANAYMGLFGRLRLEIKEERLNISKAEPIKRSGT